VTAKGIIFSAPMVRALLEGRKTQTRRLLKLPTKTHSGGLIYERKDMGGWEPTINGGGGCFTIGKNGEHVPAPETVGIWHRTCGVCMDAPYQIGDRLYVRESMKADRMMNLLTGERTTNAIVAYYSVDDAEVVNVHEFNIAWQWKNAALPSIHMPRWASRLWLLVTDVRVQRVQETSEEDALAEGVADWSQADGSLAEASSRLKWPQRSFGILWNSRHTKPGETW
jgi:hypothetical protein